ncbi:MAG TPA: ATP-dependent DNA ligase [Steroidobacteraceae bacterium]|nr:ATP-dependent DNA ligase [Steroidobacteraceae bacterium]
MTLLADLVATSRRVAATSARRAKVSELGGFLKSLAPDEIDIAAHYLSGEVPQGRIGIGYSTLRNALSAAAPEPSLSIGEVDARIGDLASMRGSGSIMLRTRALEDLFSRTTGDEQQFLVRLFMGEIRQGALAGIMADAIASAAELPAAVVRRASMYAPSVAAVARPALIDGAAALDLFQLELFSPISPMLAQTAEDVPAALAELPGEIAFEWKMDGARIQVHRGGEEVRIYTRNSNEVTAAMPEIAAAVRALPESTVILDGEAIAFDAAGRPHPFQVTMRRFGRKLGVEAARDRLPLRAFFFDCLKQGGQSLADRPMRERHRALAAVVPEAMRIPRLVTADESAAAAFYDAAIAAGHEGLMAKSLDAPYEAGNRGSSWLKIKRAHTLDLVVLAAEWGHGRRTGSLSNLHLGALDAAAGEYVMLGKTFKGLTDAMLEWQTRELLAREIGRDAMTVYVRPELVVEIAFSDLQASVRYPGGLALRLARVKRYRDDKRAADADTLDTARKIFAAETGAQSTESTSR